MGSDFAQVLDTFMSEPTCSASFQDGISLGDPSSDAPPNSDNGGQQIAIASYINPLADPDAWSRLIDYPTEKLSILVANVVNGPDVAPDHNWASVIEEAPFRGKMVIGYVRTGYLGISQQQFKTRLGSGKLSDWVAQIERDVDLWYELYGDVIGGIFFDEGWNDCGPDNVYANLYKYINDYTTRKHPGALPVLNPGSTMPQCFEHTMDTLLTYEMSYDTYINGYIGNDWVAKDLRKIWHIIYNVPESEVGRVAKLARERGAGLLEITNDIMPNPYDNLPSDSYMKAQMDAVEGGKPLIEDPDPFPTSGGITATPQGLGAGSTDFSSTHLTWDASSFATGYEIFIGGRPNLTGYESVFASVPASMTDIVLGNLSPGTSYTFRVAAIGAGGIRSALSSKVIVQTMGLPDGMTVIDHKPTPSTTSTIVRANILVPYAFVRVYLWDSIECDWETNPGWPVNFASANDVCTQYMVEGETLYKYNGKPSLPFTNAPWSWESIGSVPITTNSYRTMWTLPIGLSTTDTSKFLIQTQGHAPAEVVFKPDPSKYVRLQRFVHVQQLRSDLEVLRPSRQLSSPARCGLLIRTSERLAAERNAAPMIWEIAVRLLSTM